ncbi:DUF2937 family protein [Psychromonas hadalis]|uniref:DUF2937 family protein n=1 Tax=Psychromonas hadalis TaxID=211669 RepID=UPI0003B6C7B1|nr:DUF2937 family protein [Psychromonas hadalis]
MLIRLLQRYSLMLIFASSLLIGLQLPSFLQQYESRLDARYLESSEQLLKYQTLADLFFEGSLNKLLDKHKQSDVALFKAEADILEALIERVDFLTAQKYSLNGNLLSRLVFLITQVNQPLFTETQLNYQANIELSKDAMFAGLLLALISTLFLELLLAMIPLLFQKIKTINNQVNNRN